MKKKINNKIINILIVVILLYNLAYQVLNIEIPFVVKSDMMMNDINKYDILLLKKGEYNINDSMVFKYGNDIRIAKLVNKSNNTFTIKADENIYYYNDIKQEDIIGKVDKSIKMIGIIFIFLRNILVSITILSIIIVKLIINEKRMKNSSLRKDKREIQA